MDNQGGLRHRQISAVTIDCPECNSKGCGFCNGTGKFHYYPSADSQDHIAIARAKWRISNRKGI